MSEKQFKLSSETVLQYQIMNNDTDLNENEVVDLLNRLHRENIYLSRIRENQQQMILKLLEGNEQLKKEKEGWKLSTCRYINKDSILMMDCQIVQEALFELEKLIEQDTEQKKKFNDVKEKFKSLVNHYIK